jgi:hypothetical protein
MGRQAIDAAAALARRKTFKADGAIKNGSIEVPVIFVEVQVVTKENMCHWIRKIAPSGWVSLEKVYADLPIPSECLRNGE